MIEFHIEVTAELHLLGSERAHQFRPQFDRADSDIVRLDIALLNYDSIFLKELGLFGLKERT